MSQPEPKRQKIKLLNFMSVYSQLSPEGGQITNKI